MLLETLDVRNNDVLIYSENKFDFNENFKIIFKKERVKRHHRINYFDVCEFVKNAAPKNMLVYRLLTNIDRLDAFSTKYGFFVKVSDRMELIYFDPIFAIKDLRHLRFDLDPDKFRFKIQQLGLTSLTKQGGEASFAEVYSMDMRAVEAQSQNDKIYAQAIFAFDESFVDDDEFGTDVRFDSKRITSTGVEEIHRLDEDKLNLEGSLSKATFDRTKNSGDIREDKIGILKNALGIEKSDYADRFYNNEKTKINWISETDTKAKTFTDFVKEHKKSKDEDKPAKDSDIFNLFKTSAKTEHHTKESNPFTLKLKE